MEECTEMIFKGEPLTVGDELIQKLKGIFARYCRVSAAYLYGSYSTGRQTPTSDVDIAVASDERGILLDISAEVSRELNIPEERVSIRDLKLLDPLLRLKVVREGLELVNRGLDLSGILPLDGEVVEVYELEEMTGESWLRGNPVDVRVVREIIARINEDVEDLKEMLTLNYERVMEDKHLRKSFERTLQTLTGSLMDLLRHVVAGLNLGVAAYYKDYVDYAERAGVISSDTAEEIREIIPIRHSLLHRYRSINYGELWKASEKLGVVAGRLIAEIKAYLKERCGI